MVPGVVGDEQSVAIPDTLPVLPIRNLVLFPGTVFPLTIGREASRKLLEESLPQSKIIGIFAQKNPEHDNPSPEELQRVGVAASVLKLIRQSDESVVIIINGLERIAIRKVLLSHPFIRAEVEVLRSTPPPGNDPQWQATSSNCASRLCNSSS
jgi:ATP-dependent Lon protease